MSFSGDEIAGGLGSDSDAVDRLKCSCLLPANFVFSPDAPGTSIESTMRLTCVASSPPAKVHRIFSGRLSTKTKCLRFSATERTEPRNMPRAVRAVKQTIAKLRVTAQSMCVSPSDVQVLTSAPSSEVASFTRRNDCTESAESDDTFCTATGVAVDSSGVYWTAIGWGKILACGLEGCGEQPRSLFSSSSDVLGTTMGQIALDDDHLYIADRPPLDMGTIFRCAKTGCDADMMCLRVD